MQDHFLEERGIFYRTNDLRPDRTTLVFIHGFLGSSSAWRKYEEVYQSSFNILSVDLRGFGTSRKPTRYEDYDVEKTASDVAVLLEHLKIDSYIPISHSGGTLVSVALLRQRPQGAAAVVLMSPVFGITKLAFTAVARPVLRMIVAAVTLFPYPKRVGKHVDYERFKTTGDWSLRRIKTDLPNDSPHVFFSVMSHAYARDYDDWWTEIRIPVLIIQGTKDSMAPLSQAKRLHQLLPQSQLAIVEGGNHIIPLNRFDAVNGYLGKFLASFVHVAASQNDAVAQNA